MRLGNLSIRAKLITAFGLAGAALCIVSVMTLTDLGDSNAALEHVYKNKLIPAEKLQGIAETLQRDHAEILRGVADPSAANLAEVEDKVARNDQSLEKRLKTYLAMDLSADERPVAAALQRDETSFLGSLHSFLGALKAGNVQAAIQIDRKQVEPAYGPLRQDFQSLYSTGLSEAGTLYSDAESRYARSRAVAVGVVIASFVVVGLLALVVVRSIMQGVNTAVRVSRRIADGHLNNRIEVRGRDEMARLLGALRDMDARLTQTVGEVRAGADAVQQAATQISAGNEDLSQRTQEQASALEETASSMEEMTASVKQTTDNAGQADKLAAAARNGAEEGGAVAEQVSGAMEAINASSRRVAEIITVIDEIAFQTNLLALNAAVEAARAGEQGRGFAVVATEVRGLAQRSAGAAREIRDLIGESTQNVDRGSALVQRSSERLREIVDGVGKVSAVITEIASSSEEQFHGIDQVNTAVMQMDEVTQRNAALVEEAAAASRSMADEAARLSRLVGYFRLEGDVADPEEAAAADTPILSGAPA